MSTENPMIETLTMNDGTRIQVARYMPAGPPRGVIQAVHGFGEHMGRYDDLATRFAQSGYAFVMHDQRGHGKRPHLTEKQRRRNNGIARSYDCFLDDVEAVYRQIGQWYPGLPVVLYGHSMGGNIALSYLLRRSQTNHQMAILETPWLRLYNEKPAWLAALARVIGTVSPYPAVIEKLNIRAITRDDAIYRDLDRDYREEKVYHTRLSIRLFTQITDAGLFAMANAAQLTIPTLLLCAGKDTIVSPDAIRTFGEWSGPCVQKVEYADGYHALHNDTIREAVAQTMLDFIQEHADREALQ